MANHTLTPRWVLAMVVVCSGCWGGGALDDEPFTAEDLALIRSMALDPVSAPPTDVSNTLLRDRRTTQSRRELAAFGQQLFFDTRLSQARADGVRVSCADCHLPGDWFSDPRGENQVSLGLGWTGRNSPSLVNVGYYLSFGWDGGADSLWAQGKHAFTAAATMNGKPLELAQQLALRYPDRYQQLFGRPLPPQLTTDGGLVSDGELEEIFRNVLQSWSAYFLQLVSGNSPFDHFARGDLSALDPAQRRGLHLFIGKAGCVTCHLGPHFTDNQFHALGVRQNGVHVPGEDLGRFTGLEKLAKLPATWRLITPRLPTEADKGRFRTKGLRQVAQTAPYFHAGQAATLADVVWFYAQGGEGGGVGKPSPFMVPLDLSEAEQADLVAFLGSLTGEPVPAEWSCNNARVHDVGAGSPVLCGSIP